jgi:hypothetical protein
MVTRIRRGARLHYYIKEHMDRLGVSDEAMAGRLNISRETVWKRYTEQQRLDPGKIAAFADALDMHPSELLYPPGTQSLDALVEGADPAQREMVVDIVKRMMGRAS